MRQWDDEETLVMPAAWLRALHPRRGGLRTLPPKPDPKATAIMDQWIEQARQQIDRSLDHPESDPDLVRQARASLNGELTPRGAAAIAILASPKFIQVSTVFADSWTGERGLLFAAEAVAEMAGITTEAVGDGTVQALINNREVRPTHCMAKASANLIRARLASADDDLYQQAVTALDRHRFTPMQQILVSYLVPTETAWVDECCRKIDDLSEYGFSDARSMLFGAISSPEQLDMLGWKARFHSYQCEVDDVATLAEGIGTAIVPMLIELITGSAYISTDTRKLALSALSQLPSDEAFEFILAHVDEQYVRPAVLVATRRFPVRAFRLLAETAAGTSKNAVPTRQLLVGHLLSEPDLLGDDHALANLSDRAKAVLDSLSDQLRRVPEAPTDLLPEALTNPSMSGAPTPSKTPKIGDWADVAQWPQILLRSKEYALPASTSRQVLAMLTLSKPGAAHPHIAVVKELCDPASLAEFGWAMFGAWQANGSPAKDNWALAGLGWLGDDETVRRLSPVIKAWPGQGGHTRAVVGLDVLATIGTDVALMHLHMISQRVPFKALKLRAQEKIAEVAAALGLTGEQLGDRLVPDFGLNADGSLVLDYGPRTFTVGFDEHLKPFVTDQDGKRRKELPTPNSKDDADLADAARKQFASLKKDVRMVAADQVRRLEAAMVSQRSWAASEFTELLAGHPLVWHIVRRLVWTAEATGTATGFRVAEDRSLADVSDDAFVLPPDAQVRLAHPLNLADTLGSWSELFADYEILQPFPQLGRPVLAFTDEEREAGRLTRFEGHEVPVGKLLGLTKRGWERGTPMDAGVERWISRKVGPEAYLVIDLDPGIAVGMVAELGDQTLSTLWLNDQPQDFWRNRKITLRFADIDPVTASELLADLTELTS